MSERTPAERTGTAPRLELDDLLAELQTRLSDVLSTRDRLRQLLDAVLAIGSELDLQVVLRRVVEAAVGLVDAQYGALGVIAPDDDGLSQFITVGIDEAGIAAIGPYPRGQGLLGELIRDPQPLRLDELGNHPVSYGFPANHPPMKSFLGVPVRVRATVFGNLYLTEKRSGGPFDDEDEAVVMALAAAAGLAIANARLYDESLQRERWLQATANVSTALLGGTDTEEVLTFVAEGAREVVGADFAVLALPGPDGQLVAEATSGIEAPEHTGQPLGSERIAEAFASGTARELPGLELSGRTFGAGLMAPLATKDGLSRGVLLLGRLDGQRFDAEALRLLTAFSTQAAVVLEVAQRRRDGERLVVFEDRDRIARDLHDLVIQRLFATGMQLESASRLIPAKPEEAQLRVHRAVDDLDLTIKEIRSTIYALQTPVGTATTLRARLLEVVDAAAEQLGYTPALRLGGLLDTNVAPEVADHVMAVLREALSNAARHAGATRVEVEVRIEEHDDGADELVVAVLDDGRGLGPSGRNSGLANLAERAELLGGTFQAGAGATGGTAISWRVPLPD